MGIWLQIRNLLKSNFAIGILVGAILFFVTYPFFGRSFVFLLWAIAALVVITALTILLLRFKLSLWVNIMFAIYVIGLVFAAKTLLFSSAHNYDLAVLNVVIFTVHGFVLGAFLELVGWLHQISQRVKLSLKKTLNKE